MKLVRTLIQLNLLVLVSSVVAVAQTGNTQLFNKDGLSFEYPAGWSIQDDSNKDGQSLSIARADLDVSINVFVHRGRITPEKMPDAKKAFIDPYVDARMKQFIQSGVTPKKVADTSEIGAQPAEGV